VTETYQSSSFHQAQKSQPPTARMTTPITPTSASVTDLTMTGGVYGGRRLANSPLLPDPPPLSPNISDPAVTEEKRARCYRLCAL
jgi:hypothetical protein